MGSRAKKNLEFRKNGNQIFPAAPDNIWNSAKTVDKRGSRTRYWNFAETVENFLPGPGTDYREADRV